MATAKQMVDILEKALQSNVAIDSVTVDGQTVRFNREQALSELEYWRSQAAKETGKRRLFRGVDIGSAF